MPPECGSVASGEKVNGLEPSEILHVLNDKKKLPGNDLTGKSQWT